MVPHVLYIIDVQQGNVVTDEMLEKLRPDMTKSQVRFVMGSPLVVDAFRDDRWDYIYIQHEKGDLVEHKRLTIHFKDDRLIRFENQALFLLRPMESENKESTETEASDDEVEDQLEVENGTSF